MLALLAALQPAYWDADQRYDLNKDPKEQVNLAANPEYASVLTLSALFNAVPFPATERYDGMVTIYALGADTDLRGATEDSMKEEALAFSVGRFPSLDRDPATWQPASTRLLLPAVTAFVTLKVSVCRMPVGSKSLSSLPESVTFAGHFIDDVRASIRIRDAVANHRTQAITQVAK